VFRDAATVDLVLRDTRHEIDNTKIEVKIAQARAAPQSRASDRQHNDQRSSSTHEDSYRGRNDQSGHNDQRSSFTRGGNFVERTGPRNLGNRWEAPQSAPQKEYDRPPLELRRPPATERTISGPPTTKPSDGKIFVGGLPQDVDRMELKHIFEHFGCVAEAVVMMDGTTRRSRGFGFVTFDLRQTPHAIDRALQAQPIPVHGRSVSVKIATAFASDGHDATNENSFGAQKMNSNADMNGQIRAGTSNDSHLSGAKYTSVSDQYCKLFVGGLPPQLDRIELKHIFEQFGVVADAVVMMDAQQRSRCFGFVTFDVNRSPDAPDSALQAQPLPVHGRSVEVKLATISGSSETGGERATTSQWAPDDRSEYNNHHSVVATPKSLPERKYCKLFVGGLPPSLDRKELKHIFEEYGFVADTVVMLDPATQRSRGFGFVTFDVEKSPHAVQDAIDAQPLLVHGREVEVKVATAFVWGSSGSSQSGPESSHLNHESARSVGSAGSEREIDSAMPEQSYCRVFVGGLPPEVDREELKHIFETFGSVEEAIVMMDVTTQRSRGFGFVTFDPVDGRNSAQRAIQAQPIPVHGRGVEVKLAMPRIEPSAGGKGVKRSFPPREPSYSDSRPRQLSASAVDYSRMNDRSYLNDRSADYTMKRPRY
jgi:RNA-binding protein Musashi